MDDDQIGAAMVLGVRRDRPQNSLGHFGIGLKAAAFSQASMLTVLSRSSHGAAGRRMPREAGEGAWVVHELGPRSVGDALDGLNVGFTGTAVVLTDLRMAPRGSDPTITRLYIDKSVQRLRSLLGLVFHRLLERRRVRIQIDEFHSESGEAGIPVEVAPIDPFGYRRTGAPGYPKTMTATVGQKSVRMECHVWSPRSDSPQFRLDGKSDEQHQGFYLYRGDRLLCGGGWKAAARATRHKRLARVAIDIDDHLDLFQMSMEKSEVTMRQELVHAIEDATASDGTTFGGYLDAAEQVMRSANRRTTRLPEMLRPGKGFAPRVERAVEKHVTFVAGEEPVEVRWERFTTNDFVEVDRPNRTLKLNRRYRPFLLGNRSGSLNDLPLLKSLLYLVFEDVFRGTAFGPLDKMKVALWREVLTAAAEQEERNHG